MARLFDDGSSEYLRLDSAPLTSPPMVMACWFLTDEDVDNQVPISLVDLSDNFNYYAIEIDGAGGGTTVARARTRDSSNNVVAQTSIGLSINTWRHAIAIFPATDSRIALIDNSGRGTETTSVSPTGIDGVAIGVNRRSAPFGYMSGRIAEAAIWDLSGWPGATAADKAAEFERVAAPALALGYSPDHFLLGLTAYWRLVRDEDQDRVGGYDLTAYNTPSIADHPPMIYPMGPVMAGVPSAVAGAAFVPRGMIF